MALKLQIATVSMPLRDEKQRRSGRKRKLEIVGSEVICTLQHNGDVEHS